MLMVAGSFFFGVCEQRKVMDVSEKGVCVCWEKRGMRGGRGKDDKMEGRRKEG